MSQQLQPEDYGLKDFRLLLDPEDPEVVAGHKEAIYVARDDFLSQLTDRLSRISGSQGAGLHTVIHGSPGVGKTHTLSWLQNKVNKGLKLKGKKVDVFSFNAPELKDSETFSSLYTTIMQHIGKDFVRQTIKRFWAKVEDELQLNPPAGISEDQQIVALGKKIKNHDLATVITWINKTTTGSSEDVWWWHWFAGIKLVDGKALGKMKLSSNTPHASGTSAVEVLTEFISTIYPLSNGDKNIILLLIDEVENMKNIPDDNMKFINGIRAMVTNKNNLAVIFAGNSDISGVHEFKVLEKETIQERIGMDNYISLELFDEGDGLIFIKELLKSKRISDFDSKFQEIVNQNNEVSDDDKDFFPFKEDQMVMELSTFTNRSIAINPRNISMLMDEKIGEFMQWKNSHPNEKLPIFDSSLL